MSGDVWDNTDDFAILAFSSTVTEQIHEKFFLINVFF